MPDTDAPTVLRRKLAPSRPPKAPGQSVLENMLKKTMPRDADELLGLQAVVSAVSPGREAKAGVLSRIGPFDLVFLMTMDNGAPGICVLSPGLLAGLIEVQMSGRVTSAEPPERPATRTDGIVVSDIVDRWISTAKREAATQGIADHLPFQEHFRVQTIPDLRSVDLALDPGEFRTLTIALDLANGAKSGSLRFAIPVNISGKSESPVDTAAQFRERVIETEARLSVVLARLPRSLHQVRRLEVGDVLDIPIEALCAVMLEGNSGDVVGTGRLGQSGGQKAVRIPSSASLAAAGAAQKGAPEFLGAGLLHDGGRAPAQTPRGALAGAEQPTLSGAMPEDEGGFPDLPELPDFPD